jgi:methyltransferase (TIGR00027 family)
MVESRHSRTAWGVARRRAAHQVLDSPRVFRDPLALRIVGASEASIQADSALSDRPALRAFLAVRSRFAEDHLAVAVDRGIRQYVVLGAGLDTFAYRNPYAGLQVFEVDFPATQAWKREVLSRAGIAAPATMSFVPVDFETEGLSDCLERAGFRSDQPGFFSWLGVVPYLSREAFESTIRMIAGFPVGTGVAFDYALERALLKPREVAVLDAMSARVATAGEPFRLFFDPSELRLRLTEFGFTETEDLDADAIAARYYPDRAAGRITGGLGRIICAVH